MPENSVTSEKSIKSDGKKRVDPTLYIGTGGNSLLYFKLASLCSSVKREEDFF